MNAIKKDIEPVQNGKKTKKNEKNDDFEPVQTYKSAYIRSCSRIKAATKEENIDMIRAYKNGDASMKNKIIEKNIPFVITIAKKYVQYTNTFDLDDLISIGIEGLYIALENFDTEKEISFITYSRFWIVQKITREISNKELLIRVPVHLGEDIRKYKRFCSMYIDEHGKEPSKREVIDALEITDDRYKSIKESFYYYEISSLDYEQENDDSGDLYNLYSSTNNNKPLEKVVLNRTFKESLRRDLDNVIVKFAKTTRNPERTEDLIRSCYGFNEEPVSINDLADRYKCSRQNIEVILKRFLNWAKENTGLQSYREDL